MPLHSCDSITLNAAAQMKSNLLLLGLNPEPGPMDTSIGSDADKSENQTPPETPTSECDAFPVPAAGVARKSQSGLKFSIDRILSPEFGATKAKPTPESTQNLLKSVEALRSLQSFKKQQCVSPEPQRQANNVLFPAWVYCTRYSDRPSSGPRCRRAKRKSESSTSAAVVPSATSSDEKRPRTAFTTEQLSRLKSEFQENRYLTEKRRQDLANDLGLKESQVKIWFQNKRAKNKKQSGIRNALALHLMAQGLYNHATVPKDGKSDDEDDMSVDMKDDASSTHS